MNDQASSDDDREPGKYNSDEVDVRAEVKTFLVGYLLAAILTAASFLAVNSGFIYGPGIPVALIALAVAQMGIHNVFFLHITTGPDNTNNVLALAFGVLIIGLVLIGSIWIMSHLDHNLMSAAMPSM